MKNYYAILEVPVGASLEEIRQSYRRLASAHLDDEARFAELKEAHEALTTPGRREEYDRTVWGGTLDADAGLPALTVPGRCPMGADSGCPVLQGAVDLPEQAAAGGYCPDCGFALAGLLSGTPASAEAADPAGVRAWLEEADGRTHSLKPGVNEVGRESSDVLVPDKTVSRSHARLTLAEDGELTVEDLGSTNGTQVGEERLAAHTPQSLADGSRLRFGSVALTVRVLSPEASSGTILSSSDTSAQMTEMTEGDAPGRVFPLLPGVTTFGRRPENMVVLTGDPYVSGSHAQIRADGGVFILTDLGSTNGTMLNGERLPIQTPVTLDPGDVVLIGSVSLRFDRVEEAAEEPTIAEEPTAEG